jgi:hypothetical protein
MVQHFEEILILDVPERPFNSVLGEKAQVVEQLAETNVGRQLAKFAESLE